MSLGELLICLLVGIFLIKKEDIPQIASVLRKIIRYFYGLKKELSKYIYDFDNKPDFASNNKSCSKKKHFHKKNDDSRIILYLKKISLINGVYHGEYELDKVKKAYYSMLKKFSYKKKI